MTPFLVDGMGIVSWGMGGGLETITSLSSKEADLLVMTVLKDLAYIENF